MFTIIIYSIYNTYYYIRIPNHHLQHRFYGKKHFLKDFIYLFSKKGRRKGGRETSICGCLSRAPSWGPGPQPKHVP